MAWSGSDDAAGVSRYEVTVSANGGPFTLWRTATEPGSAQFAAASPGTYSFRVVAHDGANNVGQSSQAAISLDTESSPPPPPAVGASPGGGQTTVAVAADRQAPTARISRLTVKARKRKATAVFSGADPAPASLPLRFQCRLDRQPSRPCSSPKTYRGLTPGSHKLVVVALDAVGNTSAGEIRRFTIPKARTARRGR